MDDLKLFGKNGEELEELLTTVKTFSNDIIMQFGLDKCAKATFKSGKLTTTADIHVDTNTLIQELEQEGTNKYLGINEVNGIQHATMKEKIRKEYNRRVTRSELSAIYKIQAVNSLAVPVVKYNFNIINW